MSCFVWKPVYGGHTDRPRPVGGVVIHAPRSPFPQALSKNSGSPSTTHARRYWHAGCLQSQWISVVSAASRQCSLQYFPYGPSFGAMQRQPGCAHFSVSLINNVLLHDSPPTRDEMNDEKDNPHDEEHPRDLSGDRRNARNTQHSSNQPDDEKHEGVIQHWFTLLSPNKKQDSCRNGKLAAAQLVLAG